MHLSREYKFKFDFIKISPNYEHICQVPYQLLTTKLSNSLKTLPQLMYDSTVWIQNSKLGQACIFQHL